MPARHPLGTVANLWLYPVKSLAPMPCERAALGPEGFEGDRATALFVTSGSRAREGKTYRGKENNLFHTVADAARARALASERGVALETRSDGPHFDAAPVSLVLDRWVAELEAMTGLALDPLRFRPNLYVRADAAFASSEDALVGTTLVAEDVSLEVIATIKRCVTVTYDIRTGEPEPAIARVLARERDNVMGVYCRPFGAGTIGVGEQLRVQRSHSP